MLCQDGYIQHLKSLYNFIGVSPHHNTLLSVNKDGNTPLHIAVAWTDDRKHTGDVSPAYIDSLRNLVDADKTVLRVHNHLHMTPLQNVAPTRHQQAIISMLQELGNM
jgi:hypothetical protein